MFHLNLPRLDQGKTISIEQYGKFAAGQCVFAKSRVSIQPAAVCWCKYSFSQSKPVEGGRVQPVDLPIPKLSCYFSINALQSIAI
jgi:hypothetical protein